MQKQKKNQRRSSSSSKPAIRKMLITRFVVQIWICLGDFLFVSGRHSHPRTHSIWYNNELLPLLLCLSSFGYSQHWFGLVCLLLLVSGLLFSPCPSLSLLDFLQKCSFPFRKLFYYVEYVWNRTTNFVGGTNNGNLKLSEGEKERERMKAKARLWAKQWKKITTTTCSCTPIEPCERHSIQNLCTNTHSARSKPEGIQ